MTERKHFFSNKLFYSYYSVFLSGAVCLLVLAGIHQLLLKELMHFNTFICGISCLIGVFVLESNVSLIMHERFRPTKLMGLIIICSSVVMILVVELFPYSFFICTSIYASILFYGFLIMAFLAVKRKPSLDRDFVIILGCSISKTGHLLPLLKGRVNRAIRFAWEQEIANGKPVWFVPSGGQGSDEVMSEGSAMEFYILSHGAEDSEVYAEKESRNTYENMRFSKKIIDGIKADAKIAFCTTNYHVFRSGILAQRVGVDAEGIASKTKWYFWPNALIREYVGFLNMFRKHHIVAAGIIIVISVLFEVFC